MCCEDVTHVIQDQVIGTERVSTEDQPVWLKELDIPGRGDSQPATDLAIHLQRDTISPLSFFRE